MKNQSFSYFLFTIVSGLLAGIGGSWWYNKNYPNQVVEVRETPVNNYDTGAVYAGPQLISNGSQQGVMNTPDFVKASAIATPTVVFIKTVSGPQYNFDWFFFGQSSRQTGTGSGVIFTSDGFIVTNNHVIENAETIEVIHEKTTYKAKLIGADPNSDLAVLKIEAKNLPIIKLADSRKVQVGEWVLAVGNPFNLTSTVTAGIVSAKGRNLNIVSSMFPIESFIQTDAAINPGNSGGALVNLNGELVGINTAIYSRTGSYTGYGFAVPSDIVGRVFNDLVKFGEVQKAFLGVDVIDITSEVAEKYKLNNLNGVLITRVDGDGAADKVGLTNGDVLLKINGMPINSKSAFDEEMAYFYPGDKIKITYKRNNQTYEVVAVLTNSDGTTGTTKREVFTSKELGADLEIVSKVVRDRYKLAGGVKVVKVRGRGILAQLGIEEGFIISKINGKDMETPVDVINALNNVRGKIVIEGINKNGGRNVYQFFSGW